MRHLCAVPLLLALALALGLTACSASPADPDAAEERTQFLAMDTAMTLSLYGENRTEALSAAESLIRDLESRISRTDPDSEVSRLNRGETVEPDGDLNTLLRLAAYFRERTGGAFNIGVAPLADAWGFTTDRHQVPDPAEIRRLIQVVEETWPKDTPEGRVLEPGQAIDLGGIAKGYTADKLADLLHTYEIPRAMVSLGGNVLAWGDRPGGTPWRVGVQDPARPGNPGAFAGVLELKDAFAVTSGGYQRYFEEGGKTYHHILDPSTGYPADSGLTSVTVVADCRIRGEDVPNEYFGTLCDAFSTAFFVMGEERALDAWRESWRNDCDLVLITGDGRVVVTEGLAESFTLDEGSGYTLEIIS